MFRQIQRSTAAGWVVAAVFATGAVAAHARVGLQPCRNDITPDQQIAMGQQASAEVYREMPVLPDDSPLGRYVSDLGNKLAAKAPGYRWPYSFHVVDVSDVNAFALPGGTVFVTVGLLQTVGGEAQLAGVVAHQVAHVVLQHPVCNIERDRVSGKPASLGFLQNSRGAEQQADMEAVGILYDAGFEPRAMAQFFEGLAAKYRNGGAKLLSDHPNPGNRSLFVTNELETFAPKSDYAPNSAEFGPAQQAADAMKPYTDAQVASGVWKQEMASQQAVVQGVQGDGANGDAVPVDTTRPSAVPAKADTTGAAGWTTYDGQGFSIEMPTDWQVGGNGKSAMMAPAEGVRAAADGSQNLLYGVLTDLYQPQQQGGSAQDVFNALLGEVKQQNPGLEATEGVQEVKLGGVNAEMVHGVNKTANKGDGEHAWIVGVPQNGAMRYFVFVSPGKDVLKSRKTFQRMIQSIALK